MGTPILEVIPGLMVGTRIYTMDPKGRVTLPREWRNILGDPCVGMWGLAQCVTVVSVAAYEQAVAATKEDYMQRILVQNAFAIASHPRTGRWLMPAHVRHAMDLRPGEDVMAVGVGDAVEMWNARLWERNQSRISAAVTHLDEGTLRAIQSLTYLRLPSTAAVEVHVNAA